MSATPDPSRLHHAIMESFVERGVAPTTADLAEALSVSEPEVEAALRALDDAHGVVLHPGSTDIWVAHPFSAAPSAFVVRSTDTTWWAPCAWCALGVAAVVDADVEIVTTLGADGSQATLRVAGGRIAPSDHVVHFSVPMRRAWDNVVYTCSTMLLFASESDVDAWCVRHAIPRGDVQPVERVWALARAWYGNHRAPDWRKWTVDEAREIFGRVGLDGPIWALPEAAERF